MREKGDHSLPEPGPGEAASAVEAARCGVNASTTAGACLTGVVWNACAPISMPM